VSDDNHSTSLKLPVYTKQRMHMKGAFFSKFDDLVIIIFNL